MLGIAENELTGRRVLRNHLSAILKPQSEPTLLSLLLTIIGILGLFIALR